MRELGKEELAHVYGAGSSYSQSSSKKHGSKSKGKSRSRHASRSHRHSKSRSHKKYCAEASGAPAAGRRCADNMLDLATALVGWQALDGMDARQQWPVTR